MSSAKRFRPIKPVGLPGPIGDEKIAAAVAEYRRLVKEANAAGRRAVEVDREYRAAVLADERAAVAAAKAGKAIPAEKAPKLAAKVGEAAREASALRKAVDGALAEVRESIRAHGKAYASALDVEADKARGKAAKALSQLRDAYSEMRELRAQATWFRRFDGRDFRGVFGSDRVPSLIGRNSEPMTIDRAFDALAELFDGDGRKGGAG